jgi:hypothetical protein
MHPDLIGAEEKKVKEQKFKTEAQKIRATENQRNYFRNSVIYN